MMFGIHLIFMVLMMSEVLYENDVLKVVESMGDYMIVSKNKIRCVYDDDCEIERVCVSKDKLR